MFAVYRMAFQGCQRNVPSDGLVDDILVGKVHASPMVNNTYVYVTGVKLNAYWSLDEKFSSPQNIPAHLVLFKG